MVSGMAPILASRCGADGPGQGASHGLSRSRSYAVSVTCNSSANDQIWNQTYEYETTGYYQYENDNGQCGDLDQMPVRVSQVDGPR